MTDLNFQDFAGARRPIQGLRKTCSVSARELRHIQVSQTASSYFAFQAPQLNRDNAGADAMDVAQSGSMTWKQNEEAALKSQQDSRADRQRQVTKKKKRHTMIRMSISPITLVFSGGNSRPVLCGVMYVQKASAGCRQRTAFSASPRRLQAEKRNEAKTGRGSDIEALVVSSKKA